MDFLGFKKVGVSTIPIKGKVPAVDWLKYKKQMAEDSELIAWGKSGYSIGCVCGKVSGNLFAIDFDSKNDLTEEPTIKTWSDIVNSINPGLLKRVLVSKTINNGFHVIYRVEDTYELEGNQKLASRLATGDETAKQIALIETRGEGGQFAYYPLKKNTWDNIPIVSAEDHVLMLDAARSLNQLIKEPVAYENVKKSTSSIGGTSPFDHYDSEIDSTVVLDMLINAGWSVAQSNGNTWYLVRPGKSRGISASLNVIPDRLYVFSTSTEFDSETCYKPSAVYAVLNHNGNYSEAAKDLKRQGWGDNPSREEQSSVKNNLLGVEKAPQLTTEEENRVLERLITFEDAEKKFIDYANLGIHFELSERFSHMKDSFEDIELGHVVALGGFSSVGKTNVIKQLINDGTKNEGPNHKTLLFSLEMSSRDIYLRSAMIESEPEEDGYVNVKSVKRKIMTDESFRKKVRDTWSNIILVSDAYDVDTIYEMANIAKKAYKKQGITINNVVIDFYQFLDKAHSVEVQPVIAGKLKQYSKKYEFRTFILAQLNQNFPKDREPDETAISGSQAFFNKCDKVFLLWNDEESTVIKDTKPRWGKPGKARLRKNGMKLYTEKYAPVDEEVIMKMSGNRGL